MCGAEPRYWVERELLVAEVGTTGIAVSVGSVVEALERPFDFGKVELQSIEIGRDLRAARLGCRAWGRRRHCGWQRRGFRELSLIGSGHGRAR